jgi:RecB family endonuclease NucS
MFSLSAGQRAYLTTQLQSGAFNVEQACEFALKKWSIDLNVESVRAYIDGRPDPSINTENTAGLLDLHETAISKALSMDLNVVETSLRLIKHQYALKTGRIIDLLCEDESGNLVIIEVKKSANRDVIDQLLSYIRDIKAEEPNRASVRGIIMSNIYDEDLATKVRLLEPSGIKLKYYKLKAIPISEQEVKGQTPMPEIQQNNHMNVS